MKYSTIIFLMFLIGCKNSSHKDKSIENNNDVRKNIKCTINPETGINNIKIDTTSLAEIKEVFGERTIEKEWKKAIEFQIFGHYIYHLAYPELGLKFKARKNNGEKIITSIQISDECECKTKKGIKIGASYHDIKNSFGQPFFNGEKPHLWYEPLMHIEGGSNTLFMNYKKMHIQFDTKDTSVAKIDKIKMY